MIKICISVTSHALDPLPLSQTVTLSRTPSSVTYFMDGPKCHFKNFRNKVPGVRSTGPRKGLKIDRMYSS